MDPMFTAKEMMEFEHKTKTMWALLPQFIAEYEVNARLKREKFNALIKEGFTESQAMEIIVSGKNDPAL